MTARRIRAATLTGLGLGVVFGGLAILAAIGSAGAGHGSYVAARILFPFSMLLVLVEGSIGPVAMAVGLLQFPTYGALIGRAVVSKTYGVLLMLAAAHAAAVLLCFSGILRGFF